MITYSFANQILNFATGRIQNLYTGGVYLALSTTTPDRGGNFTEPEGNGYKRVLLGAPQASASQNMSAAANGMTTNNRQITFAKATGSWGTITHAGIFSSETGNDLLWYGALASPITPVADYVVLIEENDLDMSIT